MLIYCSLRVLPDGMPLNTKLGALSNLHFSEFAKNVEDTCFCTLPCLREL